MRSVVRLAIEVAGLGAVVLVGLGMPFEATTVLGLATAGLTVALKDFIVAFVGWFVLMGKNGLRVGDWVEIEGVAGEVAEIGILHTVLLETGGSAAAGHPTGRRVSFVNGFAIEGHFFNFSTSGQWTWDQLKVVVPTGQDPYPVIDAIQKLVERETKANAAEAEAGVAEVGRPLPGQGLRGRPGRHGGAGRRRGRAGGALRDPRLRAAAGAPAAQPGGGRAAPRPQAGRGCAGRARRAGPLEAERGRSPEGNGPAVRLPAARLLGGGAHRDAPVLGAAGLGVVGGADRVLGSRSPRPPGGRRRSRP